MFSEIISLLFYKVNYSDWYYRLSIAYNNIAWYYFFKKDIAKSELNFKKAIECETPSIISLCSYGIFLFGKLGKTKESLSCFEKALKACPTCNFYRFVSGHSELLDNFLQNKLKTQPVISIEPIIMIYYQIVLCHLKLGNFKKVHNNIVHLKNLVQEAEGEKTNSLHKEMINNLISLSQKPVISPYISSTLFKTKKPKDPAKDAIEEVKTTKLIKKP